MDNITPQVPENSQTFSPESVGQPEQETQAAPEVQVSVPDIQQEQLPASQPDPAQSASAIAQPIVPTEPVVIDQPVNVNPQFKQVVADEDNVIETKDLPWVKKAEKIIDRDKDKPYQEEEDSERLQQEYLAKNYGVKVDIDNVDQQVK